MAQSMAEIFNLQPVLGEVGAGPDSFVNIEGQYYRPEDVINFGNSLWYHHLDGNLPLKATWDRLSATSDQGATEAQLLMKIGWFNDMLHGDALAGNTANLQISACRQAIERLHKPEDEVQ